MEILVSSGPSILKNVGLSDFLKGGRLLCGEADSPHRLYLPLLFILLIDILELGNEMQSLHIIILDVPPYFVGIEDLDLNAALE